MIIESLIFGFGVVCGLAIEHKINEKNIRNLATKWHKDANTFYPKDDETAKLIIKYSNEMESSFCTKGEYEK